MNACIRTFAMKNPCMAPSSMVPTTVATTAIGHGQFHSRNMIAKIIPWSAKTDPMERSMPPVMITRPMPMLKMPYMPIRRAMFVRLEAPRKRGFTAVTMTQRTTNRMVMPSSFFMVSNSLPLSRSFAAGGQMHDRFLRKLFTRQKSRDVALVHHRDAVADPQHFFHIAADHDDGHTPVCQFSHQPVDLGLGPDVNAARRFVKDHQLGGE